MAIENELKKKKAMQFMKKVEISGTIFEESESKVSIDEFEQEFLTVNSINHKKLEKIDCKIVVFFEEEEEMKKLLNLNGSEFKESKLIIEESLNKIQDVKILSSDEFYKQQQEEQQLLLQQQQQQQSYCGDSYQNFNYSNYSHQPQQQEYSQQQQQQQTQYYNYLNSSLNKGGEMHNSSQQNSLPQQQQQLYYPNYNLNTSSQQQQQTSFGSTYKAEAFPISEVNSYQYQNAVGAASGSYYQIPGLDYNNNNNASVNSGRSYSSNQQQQQPMQHQHHQHFDKKINPEANVFVKGLGPNVNQQELQSFFSNYGRVISVKINLDIYGNNLGYGYVQFESIESADRCVTYANNSVFKGAIITVQPFISKTNRFDAKSNLYVKNLPTYLTEDQLNSKIKEIFGKYGVISSCCVKTDYTLKRPFAFICYESQIYAEAAFKALLMILILSDAVIDFI